MVGPPAGDVSTESQSRVLAALLGLAGGEGATDAASLSELARHAAGMLGVDAGGVMRFLGNERAVVVGVWRAGGRGMPINAELDFDRRNSALGRARSTGRPARADSYEGLRGELPVVMEAFGLRSSVAAPILVGDRPWGAVVASTTREQPLPADAEQRLGELAELVAQAVGAAEARHALQASRLSIVEGADEARRRLERGLHEGPRQHVLALLLKLRVARSQSPEGSEAARLLDDAIAGASDAEAALRELARDIYPVMLTERGLTAAVQALAVRAAVPVNLRRLPSRRFPAIVEATAYFTVAEALANAAAHSHATDVTVALADTSDRLAVEVRDDGIGGATTKAGLRLLAERVGAAGGSFALESPSGGGTVVRVELPVDP